MQFPPTPTPQNKEDFKYETEGNHYQRTKREEEE